MIKIIKLTFLFIFFLNYSAEARYKVRPSESMQIGLAKEKIYNSERIEIIEDEDDEPFQSVESELENEKYLGHFKIGNPYKISGITYFPQNYEQFEQVGTASWYGDEFHGKKTANGEIYHMGTLTAAHRTLPLPSIVRVTNLNNGKEVVVRVNDRGPFAKDRIIDVSQKVAEILDFKNKGTTEVKVELLRDDTNEMLAKLKLR